MGNDHPLLLEGQRRHLSAMDRQELKNRRACDGEATRRTDARGKVVLLLTAEVANASFVGARRLPARWTGWEDARDKHAALLLIATAATSWLASARALAAGRSSTLPNLARCAMAAHESLILLRFPCLCRRSPAARVAGCLSQALDKPMMEPSASEPLG